MKKLTILIASFFLLTAFTPAPEVWKNDDAHSQLGFTVTHLGINEVSGVFNDVDVALTAAKPDFSDLSLKMTAKVASIDTRVDARDNHLKSPDFFDAAHYPTMDFNSTAVSKAGKNRYRLTGNLTLHGVTKPVTLDLVYKGKVINPMSKQETMAFQVTGTLKRSDFRLGSSFPEAVISDEVRIKADGEFVR